MKKVREFSYSSSSVKADGSMSIIGSSDILAASFAASSLNLTSIGTESDQGISESRGTVNSFAQIQLAAGTATP